MPEKMPELRILEANASSSFAPLTTLAEANTSSIRTETFNNREYTVVPVVACVEGVLHGANADNPEFATAEAFGKFPSSWDGRPVVMNHPQINGVFVPANMPEVLESYSIGQLFNTFMDGKKLKTEAWLDNDLIANLGGEPAEILDIIVNGSMVEVSIGAFVESVSEEGSFQGKDYHARWLTAYPDHLAFLSVGTVGACSNEDGCGVPRLNQSKWSQSPAVLKVAADINTSCCDSCATGNTENTMEEDETPANEPTTEQLQLKSSRQAELPYLLMNQSDHDLRIQAAPADMVFDDIYQLLDQNLQPIVDVPWYDYIIYAITQEVVVYYVYGSNRTLKQIAYSITSEGVVEFSGEPEEVNLLTKIQPRMASSEVSTQEANNMSEESEAETPEEEGTPETETPESTDTPEEDVSAQQSSPSFEEILAQAPSALQESIAQGQKLLVQQRKDMITSITACKSNTFSGDELEAMSFESLQKMAQLAAGSDFSGKGVAQSTSFNAESGQNESARFATANTSFLGTKLEGDK